MGKKIKGIPEITELLTSVKQGERDSSSCCFSSFLAVGYLARISAQNVVKLHINSLNDEMRP